MATDPAIQEGCEKIDDIVVFDNALAMLDGLYTEIASADGIVESGPYQFAVGPFDSKLQTKDATYDTMMAAIRTALGVAIGDSEVAVGSIRKAIADAKAQYIADNAAV